MTKGDQVVFDYGAGLMVSGTVVEDRGKIGAGGCRLFRVAIDPSDKDGELMFIELPESDLSRLEENR